MKKRANVEEEGFAGGADEKKKKDLIAGFDACCLGLFLLVSFPTIVSLLVPKMGGGFGAWLLGGVPTLARVVAFVVVALVAQRLKSVMERASLVALSVGLMVVGALGLTASILWLSDAAFFAAALLSLIAINVGYAVLYLGWMELYSNMDFAHVIMYFSLAHFLSALLSYAVFTMAPSGVVVSMAAVLPVMSAFALVRANDRTRGAVYRQGETQRTNWRISPRPVALVAAFSFSNAAIRGFLEVEDQATVLFGVCAVALCVLGAALARPGRFEVKALYQVSVPVLVAGALLVLLGTGWSGVAAALCSNAAFTLFSVFVTVLFCNVSYRYGVNALWVFGITQASLTFGSFLGKSVSLLGHPFLADPFVLAVAASGLVVLLVALSMALISDKDFKATWGITNQSDDDNLSWVDEEERLSKACAGIAQRFGLTRREEEILVLMMRDYTLSRIGEMLFVADSTMKTHSRHIYRKVGVRNRQELQAFAQSFSGARKR